MTDHDTTPADDRHRNIILADAEDVVDMPVRVERDPNVATIGVLRLGPIMGLFDLDDPVSYEHLRRVRDGLTALIGDQG